MKMFDRVEAGLPLAGMQLHTPVGHALDQNGVVSRQEAVTWGAALTIDGTVNVHVINATSGVASTVALPSPLTPGTRHVFVITNSSGGAMGAMTWNAGYLMPTLELPANGATVTVEFVALANGTQLRQVGDASGGIGEVIGVVAPTWGAAITLDRTLGNVFNVVATSNAAYTYGAPTVSQPGDRITIRFLNSSGVTSGAASFNAVFTLKGPAIGALANGIGYDITFVCLAASGAGSWEEVSRAAQLATATDVVIGRSTAGAGPVEEIPFTSAARAAAALSQVVGVQIATEQALTNAQILTLPTAGVAIAAPAAPGAGFVALPVAFWMRINAAAAAYTNVDATCMVGFRTVIGGRLVAVIENDGPTLFNAASSNAGVSGLGDRAGTLAAFENQAYEVIVANGAAGNFTGGNAANTGSVKVIWILLPI